jgi:ABC-2 type transport system permease protein
VTSLTGTWSLTRLAFRRDRIMLVVWVYAFTAFVAATVYGFRKLYPAPAGRAEFAATAGHNAAFLSLYGPLYGDSLGSLTAWRDSAIAAFLAGLMSAFIVVRHTRADEESGRLELVGAAVVSRSSPLACALIVALTANLAIAVTMTLAAVGFGLPLAGSIALAAGIAGSGAVFAAVAAVTAQLAQSARPARGIAIGVIGVAFVLRAVGDSASASGPRWLSWLSPIGWAVGDRAFGGIRWWVLLLPLAATIVVAAGAAVLAARRDYDAGLLTQRPGRATAAAALRSPIALAWRLQRGTSFAWIAGALVYGLVIGSSAKGIGGLLGSMQVRRVVTRLGGQSVLTNAYLAALLSFTAVVAAGYTVSTVLRLRSEETGGYADSVLSTGASRIGWSSAHLAIAAAGTVVIMAMTGLGAGLGYAAHGGAGREIGKLVVAGLVYVPAALVIGGFAAALFGLVPRSSAAASWTVLGLVAALLLLGPTLQLSHWVLDASPFTQVPRLPGGNVSALPLVVLAVIAAVLAGAGLAGLRRRDIGSAGG